VVGKKFIHGLAFAYLLGLSQIAFGKTGTISSQPITISAYDSTKIEQIALNAAENNQTTMFGEVHGTDQYKQFIKLLPGLKKKGVFDIGLEIQSKHQEVVDEYIAKKISARKLLARDNVDSYLPVCEKDAIEILDVCADLGLQVHCIDNSFNFQKRDTTMYIVLNERVFKKNPKAKVAIYIGGFHCSKSPLPTILPRGYVENTLGYFLTQYTHGKNFSVLLFDPMQHAGKFCRKDHEGKHVDVVLRHNASYWPEQIQRMYK
jgi:hypothetical protein